MVISNKTFSLLSAFAALSVLAAALILVGCGGGGSGGGNKSGQSTFNNGGSYESDFFLQDIQFGRALLDTKGVAYQVVNPATYIELDPVTGFLLPGFPKTLYPNDEMGNLWSLNLVDTFGQPFKPKIVPRNSALLVDFSQPVDPASLNLDADSMLTADSPILIQDNQGRSVPIQVTVQGDKLILNPVAENEVGFPPCPVLFDENGIVVADPEGSMQAVFYSIGTGPNVLMSGSNESLGARIDDLGTVLKPVGFNPGNRYLDFISFGDMTFNGFLPDLTAPRLIREVRTPEGHTVNTVAPSGSYVEITDLAATFNVTANGGQGEWKDAVLTIRPGDPFESRVRVVWNTGTALYVDQADAGWVYGYPAPGDPYIVQRAEYYEPIPGFDRPETAVDPVNHPKDPNDPEDAFNTDLLRFLLFEEWNGSGWDPVTDYDYSNPDRTFDPKWRVGIQFSEPMNLDSFKPFDTIYLADDIGSIEDPLFDTMRLARVDSANKQTVIYLEPVQTDQFGMIGGDQFRGFGSLGSNLRLVIRVVPSDEQLEAFYESLGDPANWPEGIVADMEETGVLGVTDIGGQALGLPEQFFDKADPYSILNENSPGRGAFPPAIDLVTTLSSTGDPSLEDYGVVIHRFMGLPETAADVSVDPPITGVVFRDHDDGDATHEDNEIYGPHIADISLGLSGFLSGHAVEFIEHVFDDYNPPPLSSPTYPDPLVAMPFGTGTPINARNGVRFQQVYRRGDCSPDVPSFEGTILDLVGLAWCPIGGNVTQTYIREMSIAVTLCKLKVGTPGVSTDPDFPDTRESGGIPQGKQSGLVKRFDLRRGTDTIYKEKLSSKTNVYDPDEDLAVREHWVNVVGDPIDMDAFTADPVLPYTDGRSYMVDQSNLYAPKNQGTKFNFYHPYPTFDNPVDHPGYPYDSSRGLLIEIRMDDNDTTPVAVTNGYAFHAAVRSSQLPRFRIYARGNTYNPPSPYSGDNPYPGTPRRASVYAATDPFDELNPPLDPQGGPEDERSWNYAWDDMLPGKAEWGDNSRYFMIFNYAKRVSTIESPLLHVKPDSVQNPQYQAPIIEPPLSELPAGTNLTFWFRASADAAGTGLTDEDWVLLDDIETLNQSPTGLPYIQFKVTFEANLETSEVPMIDTLLIPFKM